MKKLNATSNKRVALNMIANIVSYTSNIIIAFVLTPFLITVLSKEAYSFYPMANTFVGCMSVLMNGMSSMASRFITVFLVKGDEENANKYYSSVFISNAIMDSLLFVPVVIIVAFLDKFLDIPLSSVATIKQLFALVFAAMMVNIMSSVYGIATFAKNRIDLRSMQEFITGILKLVLFYVFYKFFSPSIVYVGVVTLIIALINVVFQRIYTKMLLPEIHISRKNFSFSHTKELISSSVWNSINTLGNILLAGMSLVLANLLYGAEASGSYSIVQTVPNLISGIITMLAGVFYPVIIYKYAQNDKKSLIEEIKKSQKIIGMFTCAVISVFIALGTEFFTLWIPGEDAQYLQKLSIVTIMPHFIIACVWSLSNLNIAMNKVKIPSIYILCTGTVNVLCAVITYFLFKPDLVSLPIISSVLQIIWVGVFIPLYACHNLEVKWSTFYPPIARAVICAIFSIIGTILIKNYFIINLWTTFFMIAILAGGIALIVFAIGMFGPKTILSILKRW
ncbi:oligosaccharide flippase family protein [Pelosinus sp. sgz500959]|uniref:oligosaccharide flippase family protein n=1 Tax=Pelosinus sp. sgz500959 TaxID=3242472 RepID=UPI00366C5D0D